MSSAPTKSLPSGADKNKMKKGLLHWFLSLCNSLFLFVRNVSPDPDRLPERHPTLFDIPMRWDPQRKLTVRALRVAFADFSAAPWQSLEKSERGPNNSSLFRPQVAVVVVAVQVLTGPQNGIQHFLTFLAVGTRGLSKAPLGLYLRCFAPPPCSSPGCAQYMKRDTRMGVSFHMGQPGLEPGTKRL